MNEIGLFMIFMPHVLTRISRSAEFYFMFKVNRNYLCNIIFSILFAICATSLFIVLSSIFGDEVFNGNYYTEGSDDLFYLTHAQQFSGTVFDSQIDEIAGQQSQHAPGYSLVLITIYSLIDFGIFNALFLNCIVLYFIVKLIISQLPPIFKNRAYFSLYVFALPGLLFVSLHVYKDIILLLGTLLSIFYINEKKYIPGVLLALATHFFRPYNWLIIVAAYLFIIGIRRKLISLGFIFLALLLGRELIDFEFVTEAIKVAQAVALDDMSSYGATYRPSGDFVVDYFYGLIRFYILPLPFSVQFEGRFILFSILEFVQSVIVWTTIMLVIIYPKNAFRILCKHFALVIFTFLHGSMYAIIYYGNAQPRYRVYFYILVLLLFVQLIRRAMAGLSESRVKYS